MNKVKNKKLIKKLRSWNWPVRSTSCKALGETGSREAVRPLIKVLKKDNVPKLNNFLILLLSETADCVGK